MRPLAPNTLRKLLSSLIPTVNDTEPDQVPLRSARSPSRNGLSKVSSGAMISLSSPGAVMRLYCLMYTLPHCTRRPGIDNRLTW